DKHWAKKEINDMGSRMVVSGVSKENYEPDRDITRAEFAAILVQALGLKPGNDQGTFSDVQGSDWFSGAIQTASQYQIISGYGNGKFGPTDKITREQAITMIAKAMNITGLKAEFREEDGEKILAGFTDAGKTAEYARSSMIACVKTGLITGKVGNVLAPKDNITRAEVALVVQKLLQKSNLI
ncbi:MAG: S-layer homology domain-containing protein, partial [Syntrophomonas sp.]